MKLQFAFAFLIVFLNLEIHAQTGVAIANAQRAEIAQENQIYAEKQRQGWIDQANQAAELAETLAQQCAGYHNQPAQDVANDAREARQIVESMQTPTSFGYYPNDAAIRLASANAVKLAMNAKASALEAARQFEIDSAIAKLQTDRDGSIQKVKANYSPDILELESKIIDIKNKVVRLEATLTEEQKNLRHLRAKQAFQPHDPWRSLDGKIHNAKEESWVQFTGTVLEVRPDGILLHGDFGPPLEQGVGERDFFVLNFPNDTYPIADGEKILSAMNFTAHFDLKNSTYKFTNTTIDLRVTTVRKLDYGKIVGAPPNDLLLNTNLINFESVDEDTETSKILNQATKEQSDLELQLRKKNSDQETEINTISSNYRQKIDEVADNFKQMWAKQAMDLKVARKKAMNGRILKSNQEAAEKGDAYGLLRMGERYRDGEDVDKDLAKARDYLTQAAAAGSPTATEELKQLPEK